MWSFAPPLAPQVIPREFLPSGGMKQAVGAGVELGALFPAESELFLTSVVLGPTTELS